MATVKKITKNKILPSIKKELSQYIDFYDGDKEFISLEQLALNNKQDNDDSDTMHKIGINDVIFRYSLQNLPFCCGIIELGSISILNESGKVINFNELSKYIDLIIQDMPGKTLIINTNGTGYSAILEKALIKCKNLVSIKKFKNSSSKNTITIWLSNNA